MSLLPKIPLRKLFIDSRFSLPGGTATDFEIEIPQGGLDLLDNTIVMIPEISVPSFPNVFSGKDRLYYREIGPNDITFRYLTIPENNYKASTFKDALNVQFPLQPTSLDRNQHIVVSEDVVSGQEVVYSQIKFELTGNDPDDSARVLTDDELKTLFVLL